MMISFVLYDYKYKKDNETIGLQIDPYDIYIAKRNIKRY